MNWNAIEPSATEESMDAHTASNKVSVNKVLIVLHQYVTHICTHKAVLASLPHVRSALAKELYTFLLAHIVHNADNVKLKELLNV
jgi:hypothetical protein